MHRKMTVFIHRLLAVIVLFYIGVSFSGCDLGTYNQRFEEGHSQKGGMMPPPDTTDSQ